MSFDNPLCMNIDQEQHILQNHNRPHKWEYIYLVPIHIQHYKCTHQARYNFLKIKSKKTKNYNCIGIEHTMQTSLAAFRNTEPSIRFELIAGFADAHISTAVTIRTTLNIKSKLISS